MIKKTYSNFFILKIVILRLFFNNFLSLYLLHTNLIWTKTLKQVILKVDIESIKVKIIKVNKYFDMINILDTKNCLIIFLTLTLYKI